MRVSRFLKGRVAKEEAVSICDPRPPGRNTVSVFAKYTASFDEVFHEGIETRSPSNNEFYADE